MAFREVPQPKPAKPPVGKIREVFLSATVKDLGNERDAVREALVHRRTSVFLQDCWNRSAGDVVLTCLRQLEGSSGYLGVYGFRYGWVPDSCESSITEMECRWALRRWETLSSPPIFFFTPAPGSAAEQALIASAAASLAEDYPDDTVARDTSREQQRAFVSWLRQGERVIIAFSSLAELQVRATNAISLWNEDLLEEASHARTTANLDIPLYELGAIGRRIQLDALNDALVARERRTGAPALCAITHGHPRAGHRAFRAYLARWEGWEVGRDIEAGGPPYDSYDTQSLIVWALSVVGSGKNQADIGALADAIIARLAREPVVLILQRLDGLLGGLTAFHRDFWSPLWAAIASCWNGGPHRFSMVVMMSEELPPADPVLWGGKLTDDDIDYRRLLLLPALQTLTKQDVLDWLKDLGVRRVRYVELTERVIGNGDPLQVYEALQDSGIWREITEERG